MLNILIWAMFINHKLITIRQFKFPSQLPLLIFLHSTFQVQNKLQAVAYAKANADAYYAASGTYPYAAYISIREKRYTQHTNLGYASQPQTPYYQTVQVP